jgi:hypothetical protein
MRRVTVVSFLLSVGLAGSLAAQTPTWKPELLGTLPPDWGGVWAVAVNDTGRVVGNTYLSGYKRGWVSAPGQTLELLPTTPDTTFSEVFDVNKHGVVAGSLYLSSGHLRGVLWRPVPTGYELFVLPAGPGGALPYDARAINDAGDVIGKLGVLSGSFHWSEATGVMTQIPSSAFPVVPSDINEQRQIVGDDYRMDLDTMVLETIGNPTGTTYGYMYTKLGSINDAGECGGYAVTATSGWPYLPVRYTDGPSWKVFSSFPMIAAGVMGLAASGDTAFQLGIYGDYVHVEGVGSILLQNTVDPAFAHFDVSGSFAPVISRDGRIACNGLDTSTGQAGIVLLTPMGFETLGGATRGALGDPVLGGYGALVPGEPTRLRLASAAPISPAVLAWSASTNPVPLFGGVFHANPASLLFAFPTDALGRFDATFSWPSAPPGAAFYLQAGVIDPAAAFGVSMSNALKGVTQ